MRIIFAQTLTKRNIELADWEGNIQWFSRDFNSNLEVEKFARKVSVEMMTFVQKFGLFRSILQIQTTELLYPPICTRALSRLFTYSRLGWRVSTRSTSRYIDAILLLFLRHIFARKGAHVAEKDSPGTVFFIYRRRVSRWKTWRKRRNRFSSPLAYSPLYASSREIVSSWIRNCRGALRVSRPWNEINIFLSK